MEEKTPLKSFRVDYKCPKCNIGYMRPTNRHRMKKITPGQYEHECNNHNCKYVQNFHKEYPYFEYEYE